MSVCSSCGQEIRDDWKFCRYCGNRSQSHWAFGDLISNLAERSDDIFRTNEQLVDNGFVVRLSLQDEWLRNRGPVEPKEGQMGLILHADHRLEMFASEAYAIPDSRTDTIRGDLILFGRTQVDINVAISGVLSGDPLPTEVRGSVIVDIDDPRTFIERIFLHGHIYTSEQLAGHMYGEIENICKEFMTGHKIQGRDERKSMADDLANHIMRTCNQVSAANGYRLASINHLTLHCPVWDEESDRTIEHLVSQYPGMDTEETTVDSFSMVPAPKIQTMAEETMLTYKSRRRSVVWERILCHIVGTPRSTQLTLGELREITHFADTDHMIDSDDINDLAQAIGIEGDDPLLCRALLIRRLEMLRDCEQVKTGLIQDYCLSEERMVLECQKASRDMDVRWNIDRQKLSFELTQRMESFRSNDNRISSDSAATSGAAASEGTASVDTIVGNSGTLDSAMETALSAYEQYRRIKRDDDLTRRFADVDIDRERQRLAIEKERAFLDMRLEESDQAHRQDLERIEQLSHAGMDTLIAVSGAEQGDILLQLARTRALSRCTPEQILALQASKSPHVNEALKEVITAVTATGRLESFEQISSGKYEVPNPLVDSASSNMSLYGIISESLDDANYDAFKLSGSSVPNVVRPSQAPETRGPDGTVTILFSDIKGSTDITERLGDRLAQELFHEHNSIIRNRLAEFHGHEVKSMGDGFMLAFSSARMGIMCAVAIQRDLNIHNDHHQTEPILVRMGLHAGETIREGSDYFGKNVILASRISSVAVERQVLVSSLLRGLVESMKDFDFGDPMSVELKGLSGATMVYPVIYCQSQV